MAAFHSLLLQNPAIVHAGSLAGFIGALKNKKSHHSCCKLHLCFLRENTLREKDVMAVGTQKNILQLLLVGPGDGSLRTQEVILEMTSLSDQISL